MKTSFPFSILLGEVGFCRCLKNYARVLSSCCMIMGTHSVFFFLIHVNVCVCERMFVCHVNAGARKGFGSPGTGAAGGCEPLDVSDGRPIPLKSSKCS